MQNYVILSDSTCDLPPELSREMAEGIIPLSYLLDGVEYKDVWGENGAPDAKGFYDLIRQGKMPVTSQITTQTFEGIFEPILRTGKDVFYLAFSSGLSGTCAQAQSAAEMLNGRHYDDGRRVVVIDSLCASMGEGLLLHYTSEKYKTGATIDELTEYVKSLRLKIQHWVAVDDLFHLKRGGRLSAAAALMGSLLDIKPIIYMDYKGTLQPVKKVRSYKKALQTIADLAGEADDLAAPVYISHSDCLESAQYLADLLKQKYNTPSITINHIGPVIGSHTGVGTVAMFMVANERTNS